MRIAPLLRSAAFAVILAACRRPAAAAVVLNDLTPYQQDFNFLPHTGMSVAWTDDAPNEQSSESFSGSPGWLWQSNPTQTPFPVEVYYAVAPIPPMSGAGGAYALMSTDEDQALGSRNGSTLLAVAWGVVFKNNTAQTISGISVSYTGEQWRRATLADSLQFSFRASTTAITNLSPTTALPSGWMSVASLDFHAQFDPGVRIPLDGNLDDNSERLTGSFPVTVLPGQYVALRWIDVKNGTNSDAAMGIDDLVVSFAVPECSALAFGTAVVSGMLGWRLLRGRSET